VTKAIPNLSQETQYHGQSANQALPKYEAGMLLWGSKMCHLEQSDIHHTAKMQCIIKTCAFLARILELSCMRAPECNEIRGFHTGEYVFTLQSPGL
jgi:hypothetical protein